MRHNGRPAVKASKILATDINLHPDEPVTVVCADCRTWRKLIRGMIPAHRSTDLGRQRYDVDNHLVRCDTRCPGSGQRIVLDLTVAQWVARIEDGLTETAACRPTKVLRKVKTPTEPALHQLPPVRPTAGSARTQYLTHRSRCAACTGRAHCTDGSRLAFAYLQLLRQEPQRRAAQARTEQEQRVAERGQAEQQLRRRVAEWAERSPAAETADMMRRSTSYALHADSRRRLYGPDLQVEERDTREESRALAETRTEAAIRQASPVRRTAAA
ncbi:hypothetical protein ACI1MP_37580 (plasmid) [Kitasatospora griseola]|uniref:hypothetical protein n=1 Tax=Kitasatospora griseola TaxID=2064 RepID=UPI003855868C